MPPARTDVDAVREVAAGGVDALFDRPATSPPPVARTAILWHSNAPWAPTGYGQQTALTTSRLAAAGYPVTISAFYGLEGAALGWSDGIRVLPRFVDPYGNDILAQHAAAAFGGDPRAGLVVTLIDLWVLDPDVLRGLRAAAWLPVDHAPNHARTADVLAASGVYPIAMSRFGLDQLEVPATYVPHGIDTGVFYPRDRAAARARLGIPEDAFVAVFTGANKGAAPSRKAIPEILQSFAVFRRRHTDALLMLHTMRGQEHGGVDIMALADRVGIPPEALLWSDQYRYVTGQLAPLYQAEVYSAADVCLHPSYGEGFGIPIVEAQACGCPVITTAATSMPELTDDSGWLVPGAPYLTPFGSFQFRPDPADITAALEAAYDARGDDARRASAAAFARTYDVDRIVREVWPGAIAAALEAVG